MTEQEKQLLLVDLCARLPYGVKIYHIYSEKPVEFNSKHLNQIGVFKILPYLRPMSSMTDEEKKVYDLFKYLANTGDKFLPYESSRFNDWLNEHHLDYRGLIPIRLALEAPEGMYK